MVSDFFDEIVKPENQVPYIALALELPATRARRDRQFLPAVPERLFCRLVELPGKAWAVYMVLMLRSRQTRSQTVTLASTTLARFHITRYEKYTALKHLEAAQLITVEHRKRKNPVITLLDWKTSLPVTWVEEGATP